MHGLCTCVPVCHAATSNAAANLVSRRAGLLAVGAGNHTHGDPTRAQQEVRHCKRYHDAQAGVGRERVGNSTSQPVDAGLAHLLRADRSGQIRRWAASGGHVAARVLQRSLLYPLLLNLTC